MWWCAWCGDSEFCCWCSPAFDGLMGVIGEMCEFGCGDGCTGDRFVGDATERDDRFKDREALSTMPDSFMLGWDDCVCDWDE